MAEGAISSAVEKLGQLLQEEVILLSGVRDDVEWLRGKLRYMQSFLKDADIKSRRGDARIKTWVNDVRVVAFETEDVLDTFMLKIEKKTGVITEFFRKYACFPPDLIALHDIGKKILQIKSKLHAITESRQEFGIVNLGESNAEFGDASVTENNLLWRQSSPQLDDDAVVVGFDNSKSQILKLLLNTDTVKRRCVVSIFGMGGLGKTTLASRIYNSDEVKSQFSTCCWITVSQTYTVRELLKNIVRGVVVNLQKEELEQLDEGGLRSKLHQFLQQKKYFIVLDDVWDVAMWERLKISFPNAMNGSRVLITTRSEEVARSADPSTSPYQLPFLNPEDSWELFLKKVFPSDTEGGAARICPKDLEEFGKEELVKRCRGLPLAVVVLGALVARTDQTIAAWRDVDESLDWQSTYEGSSLKILALSYHRLPHHRLKSCFLYLGCFPEDYQIKASDVIRLWIAEGFVESRRENRTLEETAEGYLEELAQRCMVQVVKRSKTWKRVRSFKIHDLFREFCISEAREERFFRICSSSHSESAAEFDSMSSRRLVLCNNFSTRDLSNSAQRARTVVSIKGFACSETFLLDVGHGFKLLRVMYLDFANAHPSNLYRKTTSLEGISSLIHLRNLTVRNIGIIYIPSSIGKLQNLQTLDIESSALHLQTLDIGSSANEEPKTLIKITMPRYLFSRVKEIKMPKTLNKIKTLRHLVVRGKEIQLLDSIESLRNLQTLRAVIAERSWLKTECLSMLSSLRELHITRIEQEHMTALSDSLPELKNLISLKLHSRDEQLIQAISLFSTAASVPSHHQHLYKLSLQGQWEQLRFLPQNLTNVKLIFMKLDRGIITALERLPSLDILTCELCEIEGNKYVCSAGSFPRLRILIMIDRYIKHWRIEKEAMPNLLHLEIRGCYELRMVPEGLENVVSLQELIIREPNHELVRRLRVEAEDGRKIQHIPSVEVTDEGNTPIATKRPGSKELVFFR